ncbi:MAG: glycerol-3-phosphate 1-O-acyltransferase PlsY [Thermodesulfobacteriota bacterium]
MYLDSTSVILIVISYLLGAVPTGIIVARLFGGADPRSGGSGNIGATNVGRTLGRGAGIVTLLGDMLKGALPVYYAMRYASLGVDVVSLTALAAVLGHIFPVYLGFKGGKGVATALGVFLVISPLAALICAAVFAVIVFFTRYVSLGSMYSAITMPLAMALLPGKLEFAPVSILIAMLIVFKHKANIKRLMEGKENRLGTAKVEPDTDE